MPDFPPDPVDPGTFFEEFLPAAFAEADVPDEARDLEVELGGQLVGEGGGEWVVHLANGDVDVTRRSREDTAFTYVQSVDDWRGALWEGRGGAIGSGAAQLFQPGAREAGGSPAAMGAAPTPAALEGMRSLQGLVRMVVSDAEDEGTDWSVGFKLGPGDIPDEPTTTVTLTSEDAAAMGSGELNPLEAFMAGRIQVAGDMTLMMQMQAVAMQAAAKRG